ncbi:sigma-70 family RNA polymerase sigma factor [Pseudodesulfovibrio portus]|uniref:Uncharacterized protein n=1 Tax=Pseudodesulfovibrio portus TaxID=231439 RepID=A0ABM8AQC1_9BACT|nr:sigma-70 family RNA polymerase sigma factor [Pseudodesulfovibrio portus]BDQ33602.1 hypothetical protein JCM14722_11440 [Pseudodesulfovibrio portus]
MAYYKDSDQFGGKERAPGGWAHSHDFSRVVAELTPGMIVRAERILKSRDAAQDAVQESLLVAFARLEQLRDIKSFPVWFRTIVDSQCYRTLRKRGRETSLDSLECVEPLAPRSADPAKQYEWSCVRAAARNAFQQLSLPLQDATVLYYESGYSVSEIADILSLRKGTVRKRLHDAQSQLSELLGPELGSPAIRVGYLSISDHLLGMVAHRMHQGRNSGIRMKRFLSWKALAEALSSKTIDAAFIMAPLAMQLCLSGTPLKYILDGHHDGSALATSTRELRGKRVGVPGPYSTHRVLLGKLATDFPNLWDNIAMADTHPSYAIRSLKTQLIDAFFCAEPWTSKCVLEGGGDLLINSKDVIPGHPCCVVAVREDFCRVHGDLVSVFVRALLKARDKLYTDVTYCAETQELYTGVPAELAKQVLEKRLVTFEDLRPDRGRMESFMNLAIASGVLPGPCDLDAFVCTDYP